MKWDVFISHASEDKEEVVEPLVKELEQKEIQVWYDKAQLTIGDSLLQKIDEGLHNSRFGIVILSPSFFKKDWPRKELDGLIQKETNGKKVILPVWHKIKKDDIATYSPILAGRLAGTTQDGIPSLAEKISDAIDKKIVVEDKKSEITENVQIEIDYSKESINSNLHKYSLIFKVRLINPPAKNGFKLKIFWPNFVRIVNNLKLIKEVDKLDIKGIWYSRYVFEFKNKLYPGDSIEVTMPKGILELDYEFDSKIWHRVEHGDVNLYWEIYFEDQMPVKSEKNFRELNIY